MNKDKFERFIAKYNLAGSCESVLIKSTGKSIQVNTSSPDKSVACTVEAFSFEFPPGEFPVYETQKLKSLLNVANGSEDIAVDVVMAMDSPVNLVFRRNLCVGG
jgi:hypothetical protein